MANTPPPSTGATIASDAMTYVGHASYVFGGAPGTTPGHDAGTDCSGFVSMVLGRDLGMAIPGYAAGAYDGSQHGPVVSDYASWKGATTLGKNEAPEIGDLVCYLPDTHIGIATSGSDFVSALDPQLGVAVTGINGAASGTVIFRRVNGVGTAPTGEGGTSTTVSLGASIAGMLGALGVGVGVAGLLVAGVLGVTALAGIGIAALLGYAISQARGA
jgi:cell wall-associated NlpC family hydrolase